MCVGVETVGRQRVSPGRRIGRRTAWPWSRVPGRPRPPPQPRRRRCTGCTNSPGRPSHLEDLVLGGEEGQVAHIDGRGVVQRLLEGRLRAVEPPVLVLRYLRVELLQQERHGGRQACPRRRPPSEGALGGLRVGAGVTDMCTGLDWSRSDCSRGAGGHRGLGTAKHALQHARAPSKQPQHTLRHFAAPAPVTAQMRRPLPTRQRQNGRQC